jgi:hypothetical protein
VPEPSFFEYAVLRVVPHVEREEFMNVGVILLCRAHRFLGVKTRYDPARLAALAPHLDLAMVAHQLELIEPVCLGASCTGELSTLSQLERFRWLTSPRSTVIQISPVHSGLCVDPEQTLTELLDRLVPQSGERDRP